MIFRKPKTWKDVDNNRDSTKHTLYLTIQVNIKKNENPTVGTGGVHSTYANILKNGYRKVRKNVGIGWIG